MAGFISLSEDVEWFRSGDIFHRFIKDALELTSDPDVEQELRLATANFGLNLQLVSDEHREPLVADLLLTCAAVANNSTLLEDPRDIEYQKAVAELEEMLQAVS
jgi:hypothetical protein